MSEFYDVTQEHRSVRDIRIWILDVLEVLVVIVVAAFFIRQFLLQPFTVTGSAMQGTLLAKDRFFGNKLIYGPLVPFAGHRIFPLKAPAPGDVIIFRDPKTGVQYDIKRCVAGPGDTLLLQDKACFVNGKRFEFPVSAEKGNAFAIEDRYSPRDNMAAVRVPRKGDLMLLDSLPLQQFDFAASLIRQENPKAALTHTADLLINGKVDNDQKFENYNCPLRKSDGRLNFDAMTWLDLRNTLNFLEAQGDSNTYEFRRALFMDGRRIADYSVGSRCYFLLGDNWDNSHDSRFFGFISERLIVARASFIFWSQEPGKVRWRRLFLFI